MNKNNAAQFLPLVQALADGKVIQFKDNEKWADFHGPEVSFGNIPSHYRVKPEPREFAGRVTESGRGDGKRYFTVTISGYQGDLPECSEPITLREILD